MVRRPAYDALREPGKLSKMTDIVWRSGLDGYEPEEQVLLHAHLREQMTLRRNERETDGGDLVRRHVRRCPGI